MTFGKVKSVTAAMVAELLLAIICCQLTSVYCGFDATIKTPPSDILLITMGGTRSHKVPFISLAKGLIAKDHRVTLLSGFSASGSVEGLEEIVPEKLRRAVDRVSDYDYLGTRIRKEYFKNLVDATNAAMDFCNGLLTDPATRTLLTRKFDLVIIDSYYAECAIGLVPILKAPFMYLNTMTNYLVPLTFTGTPVPWSVSPCFMLQYTNRMNFQQRVFNALLHASTKVLHRFIAFRVHRMQKKYLGRSTPHPFELAKNVSFVLQNGHVTVSHSQPFLPQVAEIGGIHCRPSKPLPKPLNDFLDGAGEQGFIFVSMGTSVNPKTMAPGLLKTIVSAFRQLPYRILWKFNNDLGQVELPSNVRVEQWLPQQDVLGHKNIKAFVTHCGIFGTLETVYHGVPVVMLPVFADQDSNAVKAVQEGYGIKLELMHLTIEQLVAAVSEVVTNPRYKAAAKRAQGILTDQPQSPMETGVFWTEYVIRHQGASHFDNPAKNMTWIQYYGIDVLVLCVTVLVILAQLLRVSRRYSIRIISGKAALVLAAAAHRGKTKQL